MKKLMLICILFAFALTLNSILFAQIKNQLLDNGAAIDMGSSVKVNSSGQILVCGDSDTLFAGVVVAVQNIGGTDYYLIASSDIYPAKLDVGVTAGDALTTSSGGTFKTISNGEIFVGYALEDGHATELRKAIFMPDRPLNWGFDTLFTASRSSSDTMIAYSQLKVYGELIADSIQAVGGVIEMDDSVSVYGSMEIDDTLTVTNNARLGGDVYIIGDILAYAGLYDGAGYGNSGQVLTADGGGGFSWEDPLMIGYTEDIETFQSTKDGDWDTVSLGSYGVPPGAVCEIICANMRTNREREMGVREIGSSENRIVDVQEAEAGGQDMVSMLVVADQDTQIEIYAQDWSDTEFHLVGWLDNSGSGAGGGGGVGFERLRADGNPWLSDSVTFVAGTDITLTQTGDSITINSEGGSFNKIRATGETWLTDSLTLVNGLNITLDQDGDSIKISAPGSFSSDTDWDRTNNFLYTYNTTDSVGIGIDAPTAKLDVDGDVHIADVAEDTLTDSVLVLSSSGNIAWSERARIGGIISAIKVQVKDTIVPPAIDTWYSFKFDTLLSNETIGVDFTWPVDNDSTKVMVNEEGLYFIGSNIHFQDLTTGNAWRVVFSRALINGVEFPGMQASWRGYAPYEAFHNANSSVHCAANDTLELQYNTNRTSIIFMTNPVFDYRAAATLWLFRIK